MSPDSNPPPPPEPVPPPEELSTESRGLKRRYKKPEPTESAAGADPDGEIIILSSLLQNLLERKQSAGPANPPEPEVRSKVNRFGPRGGGAITAPPDAAPNSNEPPSVDQGEEQPAQSQRDANAPEAMAAIAFPKYTSRNFTEQPSAWERTGSTWGRGILYFAFAAALALLAFLVGRNDARHADPIHKTVEAPPFALWEPTFSGRLDKALMADHAGNLVAALQLTDTLQKDMRDNPTLLAYRASLSTRLGHTNDVEADLSRLLNPTTSPELGAPLNEAQGFNYSRRREFDRAIDCFDAVAQVAPFNTANLLHLGEAMRRKGRLTDAIDTFQTALLRLPNTTGASTASQREYLAYEARLSQVENGHGAGLKAETDQHLKAPAPSAYWLLTAAALALQDGTIPPAVDALTKARAVFPPEQFSALLGDYFFRTFSYHPEMSAFLIQPTPEQQKARQLGMDYFIDP